MHGCTTFSEVIECVDLQVQWKTLWSSIRLFKVQSLKSYYNHYFNSFLITEVSTEALDSDVDFCRSVQWVPIESDRIVSYLFDRAHNSGRVLGVGVQNALFDAMLSAVPELPGFDLFVMELLLPEHQHYQWLDSGTLERLVSVRDVLECDAIELALIYVSDPVVFTSLARRYRTLQIVFKAHIWMAANGFTFALSYCS